MPTDGNVHVLARGMDPGKRKLLYCSYDQAHYSNAFIPVSRFDKSHLESTLEDMKLLSPQPNTTMLVVRSSPNI